MEFIVQKHFFNIFKLFKEISYIDMQVFPKELWGTARNELLRYVKNPHSFIVIRDGRRAIGYMCYFPVSDRLAQSVRDDDIIHDDDIAHQDVMRYVKGRAHNIYILSIAVDPMYQKTSAMKMLAHAFRSDLAARDACGCAIAFLQATAVSNAGRRTLERFGLKALKNIKDGYTIYEADYGTFCEGGK
jgi:hypothetical protein